LLLLVEHFYSQFAIRNSQFAIRNSQFNLKFIISERKSINARLQSEN